LPGLLLVGFAIFIVLISIGWIFTKRMSEIKKLVILSKMPFINTFVKDFISFSLAQEWSNLFLQGLEMKEVSLLMSNLESSGFMKEIGTQMKRDVLRGISFEEQVSNLAFIHEDLAIIIFSGDAKGKLGEELSFYAKICCEEMIYRMEKYMQFIQPVVFLFVALVILGVYASIMLPLYANMGGILQ
jgi:competence protein ComGB